MYCGDVQGRLTDTDPLGLDPLRQLGWVRRLSKRWNGCHCRVRHLQDFCHDCYENAESHQNATGEEGPFYTVGGYSYLVPLKDYDRWIRPLFENRQVSDMTPLFKQIGLFFQETNAPFCEIWFVDEGDDT